ncbi:MAG: rod shape-determining protein RodA [Prolixibacteraceae bacterium]|jgi:rod shape determining protein RodA|nr:rod shape-determining protein RodA [Prolixibacteraceae bacterium]MBT6765009.1 rod shape-determining protein RodA [Prolixibacteraceae bacterium]MBT6997318.1 rod shape-determining protein RodA [Prolixibacteraceae bacterium]MBT7395677.1 rod shape-determining protein RodA [Prolixibacteraceae bacterium]
MPRRNNVWVNIDWLTVSLYLMLVFLGWINIYASVYSEEHQSIFDLSQRYGKQIIWISAALIIGFVILLIETNFYVFFSYIIFGILVFLLILVLFVGTEINGAKSWFILGDFGIQPSEFAKFATGLALARYMSSFGFKIQRFKSLITIVVIVFLPTILILLQNDTGSALVYFSFILVLYREGLSGVVLFFALLVTLLFVFALLFSNFIMMVVLLLAAIFAFLILNPRIKQFVIILSIFIVSIALFYVLNLILKTNYKIAEVLVVSSIIGGAVVLGYSIRKKFKNYIIVALVFLGSVLFSISVDYAFNNMLAPHHQARINELLGIQSDLLGAGYNVNQSKIAIGSGGLWGKGYLQGTQTKFNFVPEQSTDFIFCTVGEEWGFAGTFTVVVLFLFLLIRLVFLSERQRSGFSRIYGYTVAVILFFHFMVNIGMTIGLMPVIGIPLPFFSYGGSSLWSFTILLFVFIQLDASRLENLAN